MNPDRPTTPEPPHADTEAMAPLLTAYLDGQLTPGEHARAEAWLTAHPQVRAELEGMRRVARLWERGAPPEPRPEVWDRLGRQLAARVLPAPAPRPHRPGARRRWALMVAGALTAAAAALALTLGWPPPAPRPGGATPRRGSVEVPADEPFEVVGAHEIDILRMDAGEADALVVGEDPMLGDIGLISSEDITYVEVEAGQEDRPAARVERGPYPMIVPVLASAREP